MSGHRGEACRSNHGGTASRWGGRPGRVSVCCSGQEHPAQVGREVRLLEEGGTDWRGEGIWAGWWCIFGSPRPLGSWEYGFKSEASLDATRPFVRKALGVYLSGQNTCLMRVKPRVGSAAPHRAGHGGSCLCPKPWGDGVRKMRNQRSPMAA